jgi:hypothetical protein
MGQERHTRSLHEYWMIASRTRAFGIRHPCAERIQSRRQPSVRRRPQTRSPSLARARLLESFIRHHELHFVIGIVPLHVSRRLITAMPCGPSALNAREPPGCPQRLARCVAMWCDAQRRVVERCDAPRRAALPTVMSISPTRLIDQTKMAGREATSRQCCCRSRHLFSISFRSRRKSRDCWNEM